MRSVQSRRKARVETTHKNGAPAVLGRRYPIERDRFSHVPSAAASRAGPRCKHRTVNLDMPVVADQAQFAKLVHEMADAGPGGTDHFARAAWLMFGLMGCGLPSLPKFANSRSSRAARRSLELKSWSMRSSSVRLFRVRR